ncbi:TonB-dependent vitamin B12 receptor [Massilia sp. Root351]|uniref:TonB-dependent receptor domain-containing protein n=1 Tax=Massilia sp. Root351 TaxID=1736522 RepID=UPI000708C5F2|nr:TonB-dependent receptor [Massilia sp. Root351]KQV83515.1 TonB-dependent vitamin B12 receptor [Massilia sp. Root351]
MSFPVIRHAALTSLAMAMAAPSFAQITVSDAVIVTATRSAQLQRDVLSDVVTLQAEDIARSGAGSITDLLQRQRGIEIARNGGPGTNSSVYLRGANANQTVVLVDGVRIGSITSGTASWSGIPLQAIERIEIVYGPMSTLYGADAIGGVVQIFTKKGAGAPNVAASAGVGSDQTRKYDASISGASAGDNSFSYAISAGREQSDGFSSTKPGTSNYNADDDGYERTSTSGQFGFELAKGHDLGLVFLNSRTNGQFDSGASRYDTRSQTKLANLGVFSKNQVMDNWYSTVQLAKAEDTSISDTGVASSYSRIDSKQTDVTWQNDIRIGEDTLQVLFGHREEKVVSGSTPALGKVRKTDSYAGAYSLKRGAHLATFGLRADDSSQYGTKTTGSAGYGYRFSSALRASASFGTSFRAPTFNELYYPGFGYENNKPEQGRNGEASLQYDDGVTEFGASIYRNKLTDMLVTTTPCPDPTRKGSCSYNVNHAMLEGVSLNAGRRIGAFTVAANADWQDPKDETTGKSLARRSKKHGNASVEYAAGALTAGAELQVSGSRFDDAANRNRLGGYSLLNLYATWQFARDWSVLARMNNVTDKNYEVARNYATPGAKFFAAVRYGIK